MMTDGESLQVTAGPWAIWAISDMWMLTGSTTWLESQEELDRPFRASGCGSIPHPPSPIPGAATGYACRGRLCQ